MARALAMAGRQILKNETLKNGHDRSGIPRFQTNTQLAMQAESTQLSQVTQSARCRSRGGTGSSTQLHRLSASVCLSLRRFVCTGAGITTGHAVRAAAGAAVTRQQGSNGVGIRASAGADTSGGVCARTGICAGRGIRTGACRGKGVGWDQDLLRRREEGATQAGGEGMAVKRRMNASVVFHAPARGTSSVLPTLVLVAPAAPHHPSLSQPASWHHRRSSSLLTWSITWMMLEQAGMSAPTTAASGAFGAEGTKLMAPADASTCEGEQDG
jgi:hypothetical protein